MFEQLKSWGAAGGLSDGNWPRLMAAIEFHGTFCGDGDNVDMIHPHDFEGTWPDYPQKVPEQFNNLAQYQAWRNILISGLEAFSGQKSRKSVALEEGKDAWIKLRDRCKELGFGSVHENNLLALRRFGLKVGLSPQEVSQYWAETLQKNLSKPERSIFRAGVAAFEKARANPGIQEEFHLSETPIERLQLKPSPNDEFPLPPRIKTDFEEWIFLLAAGEPVGFRGRRRNPAAETTLRTYRFAFAWYWRCFAVAFPDQPDPDTAMLACQDVLEDVARTADETKSLQLKSSMKKEYFRKILPFLLRWNPQLTLPKTTKERKNEG